MLARPYSPYTAGQALLPVGKGFPQGWPPRGGHLSWFLWSDLESLSPAQV